MSPTTARSQENYIPWIVGTAVVASAAVTYTVTKQFEQRKILKQMALKYKEEKEEYEKMKQKKSSNDEPKGTLIVPQDRASIQNVYLWEVEHLGKRFPSSSSSSQVANRMVGTNGKQTTAYNKLIKSTEFIVADIVRRMTPPPSDDDGTTTTTTTPPQFTRAYVRAGPRKYTHFNPSAVNAAIVTCGGLCPGLNNVVREITKTLIQLYGIGGTVYGIRGGYAGFYDKALLPPINLTVEGVEDIHHSGGTFLGSSRGGFDLDKIIQFIRDKKISQLYVIGGDGTHRGAFRIHEGCMEAALNVSIAGIPKTIDNDVDYIDRSFGFSSSVEAAQLAIRSAKTEAMCNLPNGIGIVKLMGRSAGFITAMSTLASGDVDLCLVPEVPIVLKGPNGCLPHLRQCVKSKGYAVVVVAEGAGEELLGKSVETDASGNKKLPKIGEYMKQKVIEYFQEEYNEQATVKYIDPSYMIRSIPPNAADALYCMQLGQNAVHGAMAGYTGFSVGLCNNRMVLLPIPELVSTSPRSMNPRGRTWERVLSVTKQPNTVPAPKPEDTKYDSHAPMLR